jgi:hypothetical protein
MATIKAPSMHDRIYVGAHGNMSMALAKAELKKASAGDAVEMVELPIGLSLTGFRVHTDGLGASVKIDIKSGDDVLAADVDVSSKTDEALVIPPAYNDEKRVLAVEIKGGEATGTLQVNPEYRVIGY